jgi:hypothetical protein
MLKTRKGNRMNLEELMERLEECILDDESILSEEVKSLHSFEDAGVVTNNQGFVLQLNDRSEFQITVVKSK